MDQFPYIDNLRSHARAALRDVRQRIAEDDGLNPIRTELLAQEEALYEGVLEMVERQEAEEEELVQAGEERCDQTDVRDAQPLILEAAIKRRILEHYQWILRRGGFGPSFCDVDKIYEAILQTGVPLPEVLRKLDAIIAEYRQGRRP